MPSAENYDTRSFELRHTECAYYFSCVGPARLLIPPQVAKPTIPYWFGVRLFEFPWTTADDFGAEVPIWVGIVNGRVVTLVGRATLRCEKAISRDTAGGTHKDESEDAGVDRPLRV